MNPLILNASVLDNATQFERIAKDLEMNRVTFEFPEGFTDIPLIEECRAISEANNPEAFDLLYDITMQLLVGKCVHITLKNYDDRVIKFCSFVVTNRYMNLRSIPELDNYPIVVMWMVKFVIGWLSKKLPVPLRDEKVTELSKEEQATQNLNKKKKQLEKK